MEQATIEWISQLIKNNNMHAFYTSSTWRSKQQQILKQQHYECQRCKSKGKVTKAVTVHHKEYLRKHPHLALEDSNLEAICNKCHYDEHHRKKRGFTNEERW